MANFTDHFDEIFRRTLPNIESCKESILVVANAYSPPAPPFWMDAVKSKLRSSTDNNAGVEYKIKMYVDFQKLGVDFIDRIRQRYAEYINDGLGDLVEFRFFDSAASHGMDVMIIDNMHVHIRFSANPGSPRMTNFGVGLDDNRRLGSAMSTWFAHLGGGITLDELEKLAATSRS